MHWIICLYQNFNVAVITEISFRLWGVQQDEMDKFFEQEAEVAIAGRRKEGIGAWKSRRDDDDMPAMDPGGKFATDADNRDVRFDNFISFSLDHVFIP